MRIWLLALVLAIPVPLLVGAAPALAEPVLCGGLLVDSDMGLSLDPPSLLDDSHGPPHLSDADYAKAYKSFQSDLKQFDQYCGKSDHDTLYNAALLTAWRAWLEHWKGTDSDGVYLERAIQGLTSCTSDYFGEHDGASCAQWQKKFIQLQMQWEPPPSSP